MYGFIRRNKIGSSSRFTVSGLMPGGNVKKASMAARLTGGR
jgi:hypothetical protein